MQALMSVLGVRRGLRTSLKSEGGGLHDPASRVCCAKEQKKPQSIRALRSAPGFKNRLLMNVPRPGAYKLAPRSRGGRIKKCCSIKEIKQMLRPGHRYPDC